MPLICILVASLLVTSCGVSDKSSRARLEESQVKKYDLVVVPGVPLENGSWSRIMKARIYWSKYLFDRGIAKNIMFSGSAVYTPYVEAEVMARYAEAIGIPKQHIFTESKAEHSTENIYYSFKKAKKLNFKHIALASDPYQTRMLRNFVRNKVSEDVGFLPIVFDTLKAMEPTMIDPRLDFSQMIVSDFTALPERKSFWSRFQGTMGKDIDLTAYE
jgi:uncharacterized SAM-binding protein YcdF (DUF218 family)